MRELVEALNGAMKSFAPEYATDPDKAIYRIYRDTRFAHDKTPYKTHFGAFISDRTMIQPRNPAAASGRTPSVVTFLTPESTRRR